MTTHTNDTALALLKMQAIQALRAAGVKRTEMTVADLNRQLKALPPSKQAHLCRWYINMSKSINGSDEVVSDE